MCVLVLALLGCGLGESAHAQRWYGNFSFSAQKSRTAPAATPRTGLYVAQAAVNVEDVLFYKNRIRLAGNFDWRDDMYTTFREYRPIFYGDLYGYGYALNTTFSPYKRMSSRLADTTGVQTIDVYYRDWRGTLSVNFPKYPTVNIVHNRYRQYDHEAVSTYNSLQRSWVVESGFQRNAYSLRANYNRIRRDNYLANQPDDVVRSVNGTVSALTPASQLGNIGATYNYYDTKRSVPGSEGDKSHTHSVALMASTGYVKHLSASASYSGRFSGATNRFAVDVDSRAETMSGSLAYSPTGYAEVQAVKAYQLEGTGSRYDISEYLALSATLSRYVRRGVDTRAAMTRTIYQQSNRVIEFRDTLGTLDSSRVIDHFSIDTWYGSVNFSPVPYVKTNAMYSVSRDSKPTSADRTYQSTGTADARFSVTEKIEARVAYTSSYLGERLRLGHAYSESWNLGATWLPRNNLNISVTYIHSAYNTAVRNTNGNFNVYASYAFRKAFSCYVSYGQQEQTQGTTSGSTGGYSLVTSRPETWNAQLLIYTGKRSTVTFGYLKSFGAVSLGGDRKITESFQGVINFRI
jgi:hypothetical protein